MIISTLTHCIESSFFKSRFIDNENRSFGELKQSRVESVAIICQSSLFVVASSFCCSFFSPIVVVILLRDERFAVEIVDREGKKMNTRHEIRDETIDDETRTESTRRSRNRKRSIAERDMEGAQTSSINPKEYPAGQE